MPILPHSYIPISKAAKILGVSPDTLRNWETQGKLVPERTPGGSRRYNLSTLQQLKSQMLPIRPKVAMLSVNKAAHLLQISPDTLRNWDKKGLVKAERTSGGVRRFTKKDILDMQQELVMAEKVSLPVVPENLVSVPKSREPSRVASAVLIFTYLGLGVAFALIGNLLLGLGSESKVVALAKGLESTQQDLQELKNQSAKQVLGVSAQVANQSQQTISKIIAGENVTVTGGQTPTISVQLPDTKTDLDKLGLGTTQLSTRVDALENTATDQNNKMNALTAQMQVTPIAESTFSAQEIAANTATFSQTLKSLGETFLGSTIVAGDLVQDGTLSLSEGNTINALPTLYLQKSALAGAVDFFNGAVTIDKEGHLQAQTVTVTELKVAGKKISGNAQIMAGKASVEVESPVVTASSRILVTPSSSTSAVLAVTARQAGQKFVVSTTQPVSDDTSFDWWLINEVVN